MPYFSQLFSRSFWDTWDLVVKQPVATAVVTLAMIAVPLGILWWHKRHDDFKAGLKKVGGLAKIYVAVFVLIFAIHVLVLTPKRLVENSWEELKIANSKLAELLQKRDLRLSVINYLYDPTTSELVASIQFEHQGEIRRTVTAVFLTLHSQSMPVNEHKLLVSDPREVFEVINPIYVEPKVPLVVPVRKKIDGKLVREIGNILGLQVHTIGVNGRTNYTDVDAMEIRDGKSLGAIRVGKRIEQVSLDKPWDAGSPKVIIDTVDASPTSGTKPKRP